MFRGLAYSIIFAATHTVLGVLLGTGITILDTIIIAGITHTATTVPASPHT